MDFRLTDEHEMLRRAAAELAQKYPDTYWREIDEADRFPAEFWSEFAAAGYLGTLFPADYGGTDLGMVGTILVTEGVSEHAGTLPGFISVLSPIFGGLTIYNHGTEEQKQAWLPGIASGEISTALAMTEPDAGSNTARIATRAVRDGDDFVVTGQKVFITGAQRADWLVIVARTTPLERASRPTEGLTILMAEPDRSRVTIDKLNKVGMRGIDTNIVFFDGLRVPARNVLGEVDKGWQVLFDTLNPERMVLTAVALGTGRLALRKAVEYSRERSVFDQPIGAHQGIQFPLAETKAHLEAASLLNLRASWLYDQQLDYHHDAAMSHFLAADAAYTAADRAMQTLGGNGYIKDFDVERYWRELRLFKIGPITDQMSLAYIGRHILRMPKSY